MRYFVIYLAAINLITFCVYGADKRRAKIQGARRMPEKTLFALALLLGSAGALSVSYTHLRAHETPEHLV